MTSLRSGLAPLATEKPSKSSENKMSNSRSASPNPCNTGSKSLIQLNVGGTHYATTLSTLLQDPNSLLAYSIGKVNEKSDSLSKETSKHPGPPAGTEYVLELGDGSYFIDRDGILFRYILDYLRSGKLILPDNFHETNRLREEAKFYRLTSLSKQLAKPQHANLHPTRTWPNLQTNTMSSAEKSVDGHITVGYRGTFAFGRDGQADVNFRKMNRILICGKARLCREVFSDSLNESRDPDRGGEDRYSSRLYLKHNSLEKAFDQLSERGFFLVTSCGSSAGGGSNPAAIPPPGASSADFNLPRSNQMDSEEHKWNHYNEFVFHRCRDCFSE